MKRLCLIVLITACVSPAIAEEAPVSVPRTGLLFDAANHAVREIEGLPGAAVIAGPLALGFEHRVGVAARDTALLISADDGALRMVRRAGGEALDIRIIPGTVAGADRIILSPAGRAALLCRNDGTLQVVTGIPEHSVAGPESLLPVSGECDKWILAVTDDGSQIAAASGSMLWLFQPVRTTAAIRLSGTVAAMAFAAGSSDAMVLLKDGPILRVRPQGTELWASMDGTAGQDVAGFQVSDDGSRVFVAFAIGALAVADTRSAEVKVSQCHCKPTGLTPASRPAVYRLNEVSDLPVLLWDVSTSAPRVWFVPNAVPGDQR